MSDAKYFARGKVEELRAELNSDKKDTKYVKKKTAMKRIVANMTMGNDMVQLFPDIMACMQISNLEIKKMVYLYIINYAKLASELVIMSVNTFIKDASDHNPLIRAMAIRTMGYINVAKIQSCLAEPLRMAIKDQDPYVRKTAAIAVAKMFLENKKLVESEGFLESLEGMLTDSNPTVIANAAAALTEIYDRDVSTPHSFNMNSVKSMLNALSECNEWGATYILEALMYVIPSNQAEALTIAERITNRLQHANAGVVLACVKVIFYMLNFIQSQSDVDNLIRKVAAPLVTLQHSPPEIQYIALRNILFIKQKYPQLIEGEMKIFYCKYNDPIYVKLAKLELMMRFANEKNIEQLLLELKEYASEVDIDFVRKSVRSIGLCAVKLEVAADKCVAILVELIETKVNYVVQEAIVVIKDIFRRYPNRYENIIGTLCDNLDNLDETNAKASMIWIIGHYSDRIENAGELLETFLDSFVDEPEQVQLALLTAIAKLFVRRPSSAQEMLPKVLKLATDNDNPDLRDRGFIYWRLLSANPAAAKAIVFSQRNTATLSENDNLDPSLLQELMTHISSLASIYHKPPHLFTKGFRRRFIPNINMSIQQKSPVDEDYHEQNAYNISEVEQSYRVKRVDVPNLLDLDENYVYEAPSVNASAPIPYLNNDLDLLGEGSTQHGSTAPQSPHLDPLSPSNDMKNPIMLLQTLSLDKTFSLPYTPFLNPQQSKGLEVSGTFNRRQNSIVLDIKVTNRALEGLSDFAIQFNKNSFGVRPGNPVLPFNMVPPGQTKEASVPLNIDPSYVNAMNPINNLQVAFKDNVGIFYFQTLLPVFIFFTDEGNMEKEAFLQLWKQIPEANEKNFPLTNIQGNRSDHIEMTNTIKRKLQANNVFLIAERNIERISIFYCSSKMYNNVVILFEISISQTEATAKIAIKSMSQVIIQAAKDSIQDILAN